MTSLIKWLAFAFWFGAAATSTVGFAQAAAPMTFSGTLHHDHLNKDQLLRVQLIRKVENESVTSGTPIYDYSAVVSLFFGSFDSSEYAALYYPTTHFNRQLGEFLLQDEGTSSTTHLPLIQLKLLDDGTVSGRFVSPTAGLVGTISLQAGWDAPAVARYLPLLAELGGKYTGLCAARIPLAPFLTSIEFWPTRMEFHDNETAAEQTLGALNYVGGTTCQYDGVAACGALEEGIYDFYHEQITFFQGSWNWICKRQSDDQLLCQSPNYPNCTLSRTHDPEATVTSTEWARGTAAPLVPAPQPSVTRTSSEPCGDWSGQFEGILNHRATGKQQYVSLNLSAYMLSGPEPYITCGLAADAALVFGPSATGDEHINYIFPHAEFVPILPEQTLISSDNGAAILRLVRTDAGGVSGYWYSRFYGLVGTFELQKTGAAALPALTNWVPAVGGYYLLESDPQRSWDMTTTTALSRAVTFDPFTQLHVSGSKTLTDPSLVIPQLIIATLGETSYDFFTGNYGFSTGGGFLSGRTFMNGFSAHETSSTYLQAINSPGLIRSYIRQ